MLKGINITFPIRARIIARSAIDGRSQLSMSLMIIHSKVKSLPLLYGASQKHHIQFYTAAIAVALTER